MNLKIYKTNNCMKKLNADLAIVVADGKIIPNEILS